MTYSNPELAEQIESRLTRLDNTASAIPKHSPDLELLTSDGHFLTLVVEGASDDNTRLKIEYGGDDRPSAYSFKYDSNSGREDRQHPSPQDLRINNGVITLEDRYKTVVLYESGVGFGEGIGEVRAERTLRLLDMLGLTLDSVDDETLV